MLESNHLDIPYLSRLINRLGEYASFKSIVAFISLCFTWIFQGDYQILISLYVLVIIDGITGLWYAIKVKEVYSRGLYRGALKCFAYFLLIIVARILDKHSPLCFAAPIMEGYLVGVESFSILENFSKLGFPVPTKLIGLLRIYYDKK